MTTLVDSLCDLTSPQLVSGLANQLGATEATVAPSLRSTFATILAGLVGKPGDVGTMGNIAALLGDTGLGSVLSNPTAAMASTAPTTGLATRFLSALFGNRLDTTSSALADATGLRAGSASALMRMATPLVMGVVADRMRRSGGGQSALTSLLRSERGSILGALPVSLSRILGLDAGTPMAPGTPVEPKRAEGRRWLWAALAALALVGLWSLLHNRTVARESVMALGDVAPMGHLVSRRLPSNVEIKVPGQSLEAQLLSFIDENRAVEPPTWFNFDRLLFDSGKATLRPESRPQLANIAEILKAYPTVTVEIGGYTDNVGDPAANLQLSQARAASVANQLASLGIASNRMTTEGFGEQQPVADNTSEQGRASNRRIALRVTQR